MGVFSCYIGGMAFDLTSVTSKLFSNASSSEQVGAIGGAAKDISASTFPMWGTAAAIILFPAIIAVFFLAFGRTHKEEKMSEGKDGSPVFHRDLEPVAHKDQMLDLELADRWNEAEMRARRKF